MLPKLAFAARAEAPPADWYATEPWIRTGMRAVIWLCGGMLVWSMIVSVTGAVVASGTVTVESNYKTVQHLDGGIVSKILVRNGDRVAAGDVLVRLDDTAVKANHTVVVGRVNDFLVQQARLEAERDRRPTYELPAEIGAAAADPALGKIIVAQRALFDARTASRSGEIAMLRERLDQLSAELKGLEAQHASRAKELVVAQRELAAVQPLYDKGYASAQRMGGLQREVARLEGEAGKLKGDIARTRGAAAEANLRIQQSEKDYTQAVVDELKKVQAQLAELEENRTALADKLARTQIRAPRAGRVHALAVHTEGGVIGPGSTMLQIVPEGEKLIVDAQVPPVDIDKVRKGLPAGVRFSAFAAQTTPRLEGSVVNVSAAQLTDQQGRSYFSAQIEVPAAELAKIPKGHELVPGMPAEVYIETGNRTILSYFLKPLSDALARTFRER